MDRRVGGELKATAEEVAAAGVTSPKLEARRAPEINGRRSTLAAALLSEGFSLERLTDTLKTDHRKLPSDEHGGPLTAEYVA